MQKSIRSTGGSATISRSNTVSFDRAEIKSYILFIKNITAQLLIHHSKYTHNQNTDIHPNSERYKYGKNGTIKAFIKSFGSHNEEFRRKADELIDARNTLIHPPVNKRKSTAQYALHLIEKYNLQTKCSFEKLVLQRCFPTLSKMHTENTKTRRFTKTFGP